MLRYIKDASLIIFSVLLAFILNECRTEYKNQKDTEETLQSIRDEIVSNKKVVEKIYAYHSKGFEMMKDSLKSDAFKNELKKGNIPALYVFLPDGIIQDHVSTIAYEISTHKNLITRTSIDQAMEIQRIYDQQNTIINTIGYIVNHISHEDFIAGKNLDNKFLVLVDQMNELTGQEDVLIHFCDKYLEKY